LSSVTLDGLRSATDDTTISKNTELEDFTTAAVNRHTILQFGKYAKAATIRNRDSSNVLVLRLHSNRAAAINIPVNTEFQVREWFYQIFITPDGTTGNFQLQMELVTPAEAQQKVRRS